MKKRLFCAALLLAACLVMATHSFAGTDWLKKGKDFLSSKKSASGSLTQGKIVKGLKEALRIGTSNTVKLTSREDGYFKNPEIKIPMPAKLKKLEKALRLAGMGASVDRFVLSMNRAAEAAAPKAKKIFVDAILEMTFADAKKILKGSDTEATDYFELKTRSALHAEFLPVVKGMTSKHGVTKAYKDLTRKYEAIMVLGGVEPFDPDAYVTEKALDGLFKVLGSEEKKIRKDPAARVTDILKEVFK